MPVYVWNEEVEPGPTRTDIRAGQTLPRSVEVVVDDLVTGRQVIEAMALLGVMFKGQSHFDYPAAICSAVEAQRVQGLHQYMWRVKGDYSQPAPTPGEELDAEPPETPEDIPPSFKLDYRVEEAVLLKDKDGKLWKNSAEDLFAGDAIPPRRYLVPVVGVVRWYSAWSITLGMSYFNKVNSDEWLGFPADSWKITKCSPELTTKKGWPLPLWKFCNS